jgi:hypothetical protein
VDTYGTPMSLRKERQGGAAAGLMRRRGIEALVRAPG